MKIDYEKLGLGAFERVVDENSRRLSRTRSGVFDTSSSSSKKAPPIEDRQITEMAEENERLVYRGIYRERNCPPPADVEGVRGLLFGIADGVNKGLVGNPRALRDWDLQKGRQGVRDVQSGFRVPPAYLYRALDQFAGTVFD